MTTWLMQMEAAQRGGAALGEAARLNRETAAFSDSVTRAITALRAAWVQSIPRGGADLGRSWAALSSALDMRDRMHWLKLQFGIFGAPINVGGIPPAIYVPFKAWTDQAAGLAKPGEGPFAMFSRLQSGDAAALAAVPAYRTYRIGREWDEYYTAGQKPPDVPAETWYLYDLARKRKFYEPNGWEWRQFSDDVVATTLQAAASPNRMSVNCPLALGKTAGARAPAVCRCLAALFKTTLSENDRWSIETFFTEDQLMVAAVSQVGLHAKVRACF